MFIAQLIVIILYALSFLRALALQGETREDHINGIDLVVIIAMFILLYIAGTFSLVFPGITFHHP